MNIIQIIGNIILYCQNIVLSLHNKKYNIIATDRLHTDKLKQCFEGKNVFKTIDIASFYRGFEPDLNSTTINWRIYNLVEKGVLERIGKGVFKIGKTWIFVPNMDNKTRSICNKLQSAFPFSTFCVWNTSLLNEFSIHISNNHFTLVEVEKESMESVFLFLKEKYNIVFLNPNSDILEQYVFNANNPIIVKPLISEAPLKKTKNANTPTIEKILVDLFCDENLFQFYQGRERNTIFKEAFAKYTINNTKLLRYASRRGKKKELEKYINQIIGK